jgi:hypothetical protein
MALNYVLQSMGKGGQSHFLGLDLHSLNARPENSTHPGKRL